ncbi:MAG: YheC/YheD family protein [Anaerobacillus sp.]|uniref:YheC/YheD family endospore coat-associated protein n=1 Tax=Anaerobacillus sp. TaxID=1872506 RepID=UPI003919C771
MDIFYNYKENKWQSNCTNTSLFGKNLLEVTPGNINGHPGFPVKKRDDKVGPLVAILTSKEGRPDFYGNRSTFKRIHDCLQSSGGISFVMTPEGYDGEKIVGYLYDDGEWRKVHFPLPDIIYNRVASYKAEKQLGAIRNMAFNNAIPFYNPHFFEKWETYKQLNENEFLKKYLPDTELLESKAQLENWLVLYRSILIKPILSNRGNGIFLINKLDDLIEVKSNNSRKQYESISDVWDELNPSQQRSNIIQRKVNLKQYNKRPFDLRILVQRKKDLWEITGIGVRRAADNAITTHVPWGGQVLPFETISTGLSIEEVDFLADQVARQLELAYGYLCEFSIDLGIDEDGHLWIFEVNSKPMKFDEPHIQEKALTTLIECFNADAGFS